MTGPTRLGEPSRELLRDAAIIVAVHALLCVVARLAGLDHVSDDDFSRVTIAESFAHEPKLDPSGTSWLPFPFWLLGSTLAIFGRSLTVARAASIAFASLAAALPYFALRYSAVPRIRALVATAFAFLTPWCIWVGASTVPESFTASFITAAAVAIPAIGTERERDDLLRPSRAALFFAAVIAAACLSRYEAWPVAAVLAGALVLAAVRSPEYRRAALGGALVCIAAPLAWMAWNAHAHDGPLHFFRRVSSFKQSIGAGERDVVSALALYPKLLFSTRPEIAIPALFLLPSALGHSPTRQRWGVPLLCVVAQLVFLAYGNARDGAPTHHPERAILGAMMILALFVVDAGMTKLADLAASAKSWAVRGAAATFALAWIISSVRGATPPGQGPEDRSAAVARGERLREEKAESVVVTPCAFEHFALIAAFGAPERVTIEAASYAPASECPRVRQR